MLAVIFHYWLGLLLVIVSVIAVIGLVVGYVKSVSAPQYPPQQRDPER